MLSDFINFLGLSDKKNNSKIQTNVGNPATKENTENFIIEMQSPYFEEEIATETIIKNNKKIEIKKINKNLINNYQKKISHFCNANYLLVRDLQISF